MFNTATSLWFMSGPHVRYYFTYKYESLEGVKIGRLFVLLEHQFLDVTFGVFIHYFMGLAY